MKRLIVLIVSLSAILIACSGSDVITTCKSTGNGSEYKATMSSKDGKVLTHTSESNADLGSLALSKDELLEFSETVADSFDYDGVVYEYKIVDEVFVSKTRIDYEEADFEELYEAGLITKSEEEYAKLDVIVKDLESKGYKCSSK